MCSAALAVGGIQTGVQVFAQQKAASRKNELAKDAAEDLIAKSSGMQSASYMKRTFRNANIARESYARGIESEESLAKLSVDFGDTVGTPYSDNQRKLKNSFADAWYSLALAGEIGVLEQKEEMSSIFQQTRSQIAALETVSREEQLFAAISSGLGGAKTAMKLGGLKAPSNDPVDVSSGGGGGPLRGKYELPTDPFSFLG